MRAAGIMAATQASPYALECCVDSDSLRHMRSMLLCLHKFGQDLFLEANENEVATLARRS